MPRAQRQLFELFKPNMRSWSACIWPTYQRCCCGCCCCCWHYPFKHLDALSLCHSNIDWLAQRSETQSQSASQLASLSLPSHQRFTFSFIRRRRRRRLLAPPLAPSVTPRTVTVLAHSSLATPFAIASSYFIHEFSFIQLWPSPPHAPFSLSLTPKTHSLQLSRLHTQQSPCCCSLHVPVCCCYYCWKHF